MFCSQGHLRRLGAYRFYVIVEGPHEVISGDLQLLGPLHVHFHCRCSLEKNIHTYKCINMMSGVRGTPLSLQIKFILLVITSENGFIMSSVALAVVGQRLKN